jgi:hypothetical protein
VCSPRPDPYTPQVDSPSSPDHDEKDENLAQSPGAAADSPQWNEYDSNHDDYDHANDVQNNIQGAQDHEDDLGRQQDDVENNSPGVQHHGYDDVGLQQDGGDDTPSISDYVRSLTLGGRKYTCVGPDTPESPFQTWVLTAASMTDFVFVTLVLVKGCLLSFCHRCPNATPETEVRQWLTRTPEQFKLLFQTTAEKAMAASALCRENRCRHCAGLIKV